MKFSIKAKAKDLMNLATIKGNTHMLHPVSKRSVNSLYLNKHDQQCNGDITKKDSK